MERFRRRLHALASSRGRVRQRCVSAAAATMGSPFCSHEACAVRSSQHRRPGGRRRRGGAAPDLAAVDVPQASVRLVACSMAAHEAAFKGRMLRLARRGANEDALHAARAHRRRGLRAREGARPRRAGGARGPGSAPSATARRCKGLPRNAIHRMRVDFRWYDADGEVVARARRRSRACRQFEALPNLGVAIVGSPPTKGGVRRYRARVVNVGGRAQRVTGTAVRFGWTAACWTP